MILNRLAGLGQRGPPPGPEYYVVRSTSCYLLVSRQTAQRIMEQLQRLLPPRWIRVVDLSGSEVWLPSRSIEMVVESTADQRAHDRQLRRQLDDEDEDSAPA